MRLLASLAVAVFATLCAPAFAQVTVDGDLSDIRAVAQGDQSDPINEICFLAKSGFDLRWLYVYYDVDADALYFGLDLMDVPDPNGGGGVGLNGPGVPGDVDGDLDPSTATEPACPVEEEQTGVGPDEMYLIKVDTNANGLFNEAVDVRIIYRGDTLRFEHGDATPLFGVTGDVVLGTRGAPVDPHLPNQNRNTDDIEIAVYDWSTLDPVPTCFMVTTFCGSLVDGFPEDELVTPVIVQAAAPAVDLTKEVRNVTSNGTFGKSASVEIGDTVEFRLTLANVGNVDISPAAIMDHLPSDLQFIPGSVVGADTVQQTPEPGGELITLKQLGGAKGIGKGELRVVTFQATVLATIEGAVVNTAEGGGVGPSECGDSEAVGSDQATVSVVDLECTKQVSLDGVNFVDDVQAAQGQDVHFRVTLSNPSAVDLTDATIVDTLPAGLTSIVAPGCTISGQTVTCVIGNLPAQSSVSVDIQATVASSATGTLVNTADCTANFDDTMLMTSCQATVEVLVPGIVCDKQVSYDGSTWTDNIDVFTGMDVFFRVIATNTGTAPLYEVTVSDPLPNGYGNVQIVSGATCSVAGKTVSCTNVGPLGAGESATVIYRAVVTATSGTLVNTATVNGTSGSGGNPGDSVQTQCSASVDLLSPCVTCLKEVSSDGFNYGPSVNVQGGDHVWFRVTVTNCGNAALTDVELSDTLPFGFVNASTADAACGVAGSVVTCSVAALSAGQSHQFFFEADVDALASGILVNTANISATPTVSGHDGAPLSSQCSAQVVVGPLEIPTLTEWGMILLCSLLALSTILHFRFRS